MIVQVKKDSNNESDKDNFKRFEDEGVIFKAKLIGSELVLEPRGDKMCQNSIQRLKAIIKGTNSHKRRVVLKISYDGVKVYDEKTNEILHHHQVSQISFIASDDTDNRTFGYVGDVPNKAHQFVCFKTSGPAINVISVINSLFEAVVDKKKQAEKEKQEEKEKKIINDDDIFTLVTDTTIPAATPITTGINITATSTPATTTAPPATVVVASSSLIKSDSFVDRYAAFNDIDNLPSIFESTSLNSVNKMSLNNINSSTGSILEPANMSSSSTTNMGLFGGGGGGGSVGKPSLSSMPKPNSSTTISRQIPNFHMAAAHNNFSKSFNTTYLQQTSSASSGFVSFDQDISSTSAGTRSASTLETNIFRRTNPFDDDFFA